ncbi:signal transduction histidine kinase [Novosphingobium sp. 1529]|uniref:sensor histidine kinase n=1 Tax=Novosphingobium sp. 1529 TaxID=3156424 RepID=UPI003399E48C
MTHTQGKLFPLWRGGAVVLFALCGLAGLAASGAGAPPATVQPHAAQQPAPLPAPPPAWQHRSWTARDHAPRFVQSLAQDRDGFLWVGSVEGLFRFDGTTFEAVPPPPGHPRAATAVSALAAAPDGSIWLGYAGRGGVAVYRDGRLHDAGRPGDAAEITSITIGPDGEPWIAVGDGEHAVYRHTATGWQAMIAPTFDTNEAEPQLLSRQGDMWFVTWGGQPFRWPIGPGPFRPTAVPLTVSGGGAMMQTPDDALYLIDSHGLRRVPDRGAAARLVVPGTALPSANFYRAVADPFGRIWATTAISGLVAIWPRSGAVERIGEEQGLTSDRASPILADRDGNVWVGTERGLDRFSPSPLRVLPNMAPRGGSGLLATAQGGRVYLANDAAVYQIDPGQAPRALAQVPPWVMGLCAGANGDVWAISPDHAQVVAGPHRGQTLPMPRHVLEVKDCAADASGALWLSPSGLGLLHQVGARLEPVALDPRLGQPQSLAFDRQGRLVMILDRRTIARLDHGALSTWDGSKIGFERPGTLSVRADDVLVGGTTGLLRLDDKGVQVLDARDHPWLFDTRGVVSTAAGQTWLIGYHGLSRVSTAALTQAFANPTRPIPHVTFDDDDRRIALPQAGAGEQIVRDGQDRVFALTRQGVLEALPWANPLPETRFSLFVRALGANGHEWPARPGLALPVGTTQVTIRYGVLDLATPAQRRFRVRLGGLDDGWVANGTAQDISYANLAPGTYRFDVQTTDREGAWQPQGAALTFTIRAAFWQTTWFRLAVAALVLFVAQALYRQRTRVLIARAKAKREGQIAERERIARELHDTLLQGVQGLILRFQAVAARGALDRTTRAELDAALERGDDVVAAARDRVIDLRSPAPDAVDLARALAPLCSDGHVPPVILRCSGKPRTVAIAVAEECVAIAHEAVANARRHAQAKTITIALHHGRRMLTLRISDDGVGFTGATQGAAGHFGLIGMRERAATLGARIEIRNGATGGVVVQLQVPGRRAYRA